MGVDGRDYVNENDTNGCTRTVCARFQEAYDWVLQHNPGWKWEALVDAWGTTDAINARLPQFVQLLQNDSPFPAAARDERVPAGTVTGLAPRTVHAGAAAGQGGEHRWILFMAYTPGDFPVRCCCHLFC
jgi:hypothetical protein